MEKSIFCVMLLLLGYVVQRIKDFGSTEVFIWLKAAEQNDVFPYRQSYPLEC